LGGAVEGTVVVGEAAVGNAAIVGAGQTIQDGFGLVARSILKIVPRPPLSLVQP
jgi:hypothetical protein